MNSRSPSVHGLIVEDALRYLAAQNGALPAATRLDPKILPDVLHEPPPEHAQVVRRPGSAAAYAPSAPVILVTGAAGQIGRRMTLLLNEHGLAHRDIDLVPVKTAAPSFQCDLADPTGLERLAEFCCPVTHVIHLASRISNSKSMAEHYGEQFRINVVGTLNLLKALPETLRHFCFASTMTVYGSPRSLPVAESHPTEPNCIYALCKLAAERYLTDFNARSGVPVALLRYSSAYGPGPAPGRAIPRMIQRLMEGQAAEIYGSGSVQRDYIYVDDLCRATLQASLRGAAGIFNIGTGVGTTTAELADTLTRLIGLAKAPVIIPRALDAQSAASLVYDIGKMRRELGYAPEFSLKAGLAETIRYFQISRNGRYDEYKTDAAHSGRSVGEGIGTLVDRAQSRN